MKKKIYYKVVGPDLRSCAINLDERYLNKQVSVRYKIGEFVEPNIEHTSLMVFNTYTNARDFVLKQWMGDCEIYKVRCEGISKHGIFMRVMSGSFYQLNVLHKVITLKKQKKKYTHLCHTNIPPGSLFAKRVKLIETV